MSDRLVQYVGLLFLRPTSPLFGLWHLSYPSDVLCCLWRVTDELQEPGSLLHGFLKWATLWLGSHIPLLPQVSCYHFYDGIASFYQDTSCKTLIPGPEPPTTVCGLSKLVGNSRFSLCITKARGKLVCTLPSSPTLYFLASHKRQGSRPWHHWKDLLLSHL